MPFSYKTKWMIEHPAWTWAVFAANTVLIAIVVASIIVLVAQQNYLVYEVNQIDGKIVKAVKANQTNVETVAKKAGVAKHKLIYPELPDIPKEK